MKLVIVESPTKAKTIGKFLGKEFTVESSFGHIRDLPKGKLGVDVEHDFSPTYVIPRTAQKQVTALKKLSAKADSVILAADEDREGEAIAWHLFTALNLDKKNKDDVQRIVFHEITKSAIDHALKNPRDINLHMVDAQQMRRVLDRLVGYELSPFLWKKITKGLSAGRVQSVALRLIVDRENEIRAFKPEEFWTIESAVTPDTDANQFVAELRKKDGKALDKFAIKTGDAAAAIQKELEADAFVVAAVEEKETKRNAQPPFITSTLQRSAANRLGFSAKQTMRAAQGLYEKGFITYMRTDSVNLSQESLSAAAAWIEQTLGKEYAVDAPRVFTSKSKLAQEAHEAVRPTKPAFLPRSMGGETPFEEHEEKLYDLIWRRFIASQLPAARFNSVAVTLKNGVYEFVANGITQIFDGFMKIWLTSAEDKVLPKLTENQKLKTIAINPLQHFTEPPARFNEASLIKTLEEYGIGRPSTYASIISVIIERNYVTKEKKNFVPTETGMLVSKVLVENFPKIVDVDFTAHLEDDLDNVANGDGNWKEKVRDFYIPFHKALMEKYESVAKIAPAEITDRDCPKCGKKLAIKLGRFGKFLACTGFPDCKHTESLGEKTPDGEPEGTPLPCPECKEGLVVKKRTRRNSFFWGCNRYPDCKYASWKNPALPDEAPGETPAKGKGRKFAKKTDDETVVDTTIIDEKADD